MAATVDAAAEGRLWGHQNADREAAIANFSLNVAEGGNLLVNLWDFEIDFMLTK